MAGAPLTGQEYVALRERAPEFLGDLMDHVTEVVKEAGWSEERASLLALDVALRLRTRWAKQMIYFAEGRRLDLRSRYQAIWEEFTGHNQDELAVRYGFSRVWVYRIVKAMRAEDQAARQGKLPL